MIRSLAKRTTFVNHYSFHLMDPEWARDDQDVGPSAVRRSGHLERPSARLLSLLGWGLTFVKEGNCFTHVADPGGPGQVTNTLSAIRL